MKDEVGNKVRNIQGWWPLLLLLLWCWLLTHFLYSTYTNRYLGKWSFPDGFSPIFQNPIICEKISSHFFESLCKNSHHFFYCVIFGLTSFLMRFTIKNYFLIHVIFSDEERYGQSSQGTELLEGKATFWRHGMFFLAFFVFESQFKCNFPYRKEEL